jgi:8-oxo-dGTP diphosphatase
VRDTIRNLISAITPFDEIERDHKENSIQWISSGVEICRLRKPDIPPKHLVSYFVLVDRREKKLLLIKHRKAGLWLPPGGHVEKNENPVDTVKREIQEELETTAQFISNKPFFITITQTVNIDAGHIDVSLWYLLKGDSSATFVFNKREMDGYKWFSFEEILKTRNTVFDPHMIRFINKLMKIID